MVQGAIEIPCIIKVSMAGIFMNQLEMERYKQLIEALYNEPKYEETLNLFLHVKGTVEMNPIPTVYSK